MSNYKHVVNRKQIEWLTLFKLRKYLLLNIIPYNNNAESIHRINCHNFHHLIFFLETLFLINILKLLSYFVRVVVLTSFKIPELFRNIHEVPICLSWCNFDIIHKYFLKYFIPNNINYSESPSRDMTNRKRTTCHVGLAPDDADLADNVQQHGG